MDLHADCLDEPLLNDWHWLKSACYIHCMSQWDFLTTLTPAKPRPGWECAANEVQDEFHVIF